MKNLFLIIGFVFFLCSTAWADTETLRPSAAGDECSIENQTGETCPNHYQNVDEETADGTTTCVYLLNEATYQRDLYNLPASSGLGTINYIKIYFRCCFYNIDVVSITLMVMQNHPLKVTTQ